jgi:hypothetical protein
MSIFKDQSYLRIQLSTGVNITDALEISIYYRKPDATIASVTAQVLTSNPGVIYYDMPATSFLDQTGNWKFWAFIKFSDGREARGETVTEKIYSDEK